MTHTLTRTAAIAAAIAVLSVGLVAHAAPTASPNPSRSPSPTPSPAGTSSPAGNASPAGASSPAAVLSPPPASLKETSSVGKIGALERAGAGPLLSSRTPRRKPRTTQPSAFSSYLTDSDPVVAARAAIAVGRLRNPGGAAALVDVLQSRTASDQVKTSAAFALGTIGSQNGQAALVNMVLHGPAAVAGAAADSLGRIGGDSVIDPLVRALSSGDPYVRGKAAIGLGEATSTISPPRLIDTPYRLNAGRALATAIRYERDPEAKWRMAWAIGRSLYDVDQESLRTMIADRDELVREFAVQGMRKLRDPKFALALHLAAADTSWRVRAEVARALALMKDTTHVDLTPPEVPDVDQVEPKAVDKGTPFGDHPQVAIVTSKGVVVVELFPDEAPYTVDNFLYLVDRGYYDNEQLFRVIQNFVIQGGDPTNSGDGGPGYTIPAELNPLEQLTGMLAFGLDYPDNVHADVDSAGSQFYITESPQLHLDMNFSTFGRVVKGMAVVDAIRPHSADSPAERAKPVDIVTKMYRCEPVIAQTADIELLLRTKEIGYDAR